MASWALPWSPKEKRDIACYAMVFCSCFSKAQGESSGSDRTQSEHMT